MVQSGLLFENRILASLFFLMSMRNDLDRRAQEAIRFPELIFQIAQIGKMEQLRVVDVQDKSRRIHSDLGTVVDLQLATGVGRGRVGILGIP
jgi:hypothetical protein